MLPHYSKLVPYLDRMIAGFPPGFDVNIGNLPYCVAPHLAKWIHHDGEQTFTGRHGGSAVGHGSFLTASSSPDGASGCYDGKGVAEIPMDLTVVTESPFVSSHNHSARNSSDARR